MNIVTVKKAPPETEHFSRFAEGDVLVAPETGCVGLKMGDRSILWLTETDGQPCKKDEPVRFYKAGEVDRNYIRPLSVSLEVVL